MIKQLLMTLSLMGALALAVPVPAHAAKELLHGVDCSRAANSTVCEEKGTKKDPLSGEKGTLIKATRIVAFAGGVAAIVMILYGAIRFITSGSDISTGARTDTDVEAARQTITYALVGLAVIVLAQTIIVFVLNKL